MKVLWTALLLSALLAGSCVYAQQQNTTASVARAHKKDSDTKQIGGKTCEGVPKAPHATFMACAVPAALGDRCTATCTEK